MFIHGLYMAWHLNQIITEISSAMIFIPLFLSLYFQCLIHSRLSAIVDGILFSFVLYSEAYGLLITNYKTKKQIMFLESLTGASYLTFYSSKYLSWFSPYILATKIITTWLTFM